MASNSDKNSNKYMMFWNNKGGVGKTTCTFHTSAYMARTFPDRDVLVVDLCPQANISFLFFNLLTPDEIIAKESDPVLLDERIHSLIGSVKYQDSETPKTVMGYLTNVLSKKPWSAIEFASQPRVDTFPNLFLLSGDINLDMLSSIAQEHMSKTPLPFETPLSEIVYKSGRAFGEKLSKERKRPLTVLFDCSPQFTLWTKIAISSCDHWFVPYTIDSLGLQGIKNAFSLIYGTQDSAYKSQWNKLVKKKKLSVPKFEGLVANRCKKIGTRTQSNSKFQNTKKETKVAKLTRKIIGLARNIVKQQNPNFSHHKIYDFNACQVATIHFCISLTEFQERWNSIKGNDPYSLPTQTNFYEVYGVTKIMFEQSKTMSQVTQEIAQFVVGSDLNNNVSSSSSHSSSSSSNKKNDNRKLDKLQENMQLVATIQNSNQQK